METQSLVFLIGGLGMFLMGIHHLTEGLKGFAGDALRRALDKLVSGKWSALLSGAVFTAIIQSSSAATLTVIGFVSAGLVTFPQAVAVVLGANIGTTATSWLVAVFGLKINIASAALPILGIGAFLWLMAKGRVRAVGAVLAGFGLVFTGIDFLQTGMAGIEWNLDGLGTGPAAPWLLAGIGAIMTVAMQSSSAAGATTLVALSAGTITLDQAFAMVVGQNLGTTATAAIAAAGGGLAVKRTALAHILFNAVTGILALLFLGFLTPAARWLGDLMDDPSGVLTLAVFHTLFNLLGVLLFFPWLGAFARGIEIMTGRGRVSAVARLDPTLAAAGGQIALEAAWRAMTDITKSAFHLLKSRISGEKEEMPDLQDEIQQVRSFIEGLHFESSAPALDVERRIGLWHALDHLSRLSHDLSETPFNRFNQAPFEAELQQATSALDAWLTENNGENLAQLEASSTHLAEARKKVRKELLEQVALGRSQPQEATAMLEGILWIDGALYHAWRAANALRNSATADPTPQQQ